MVEAQRDSARLHIRKDFVTHRVARQQKEKKKTMSMGVMHFLHERHADRSRMWLGTETGEDFCLGVVWTW